MDCQDISEYWSAVHCWNLLVVVRYPLLLVVCVILFVESFSVFFC